jgi:lupus La protein
MSADVAAPDAAPTANRDKNARAAEEAKKMLAELSGGATVETDAADANEEKTNGNTQDTGSSVEKQSSEEPSKDKREEGEPDRTKGRRDRDDGRSSRGGRGRGGYQARAYRDNIKSDLTTQEESSDPVAIRKQVLNDCWGL